MSRERDLPQRKQTKERLVEGARHFASFLTKGRSEKVIVKLTGKRQESSPVPNDRWSQAPGTTYEDLERDSWSARKREELQRFFDERFSLVEDEQEAGDQWHDVGHATTLEDLERDTWSVRKREEMEKRLQRPRPQDS